MCLQSHEEQCLPHKLAVSRKKCYHWTDDKTAYSWTKLKLCFSCLTVLPYLWVYCYLFFRTNLFKHPIILLEIKEWCFYLSVHYLNWHHASNFLYTLITYYCIHIICACIIFICVCINKMWYICTFTHSQQFTNISFFSYFCTNFYVLILKNNLLFLKYLCHLLLAPLLPFPQLSPLQFNPQRD